jgi:hypothetical protein
MYLEVRIEQRVHFLNVNMHTYMHIYIHTYHNTLLAVKCKKLFKFGPCLMTTFYLKKYYLSTFCRLHTSVWASFQTFCHIEYLCTMCISDISKVIFCKTRLLFVNTIHGKLLLIEFVLQKITLVTLISSNVFSHLLSLIPRTCA